MSKQLPIKDASAEVTLRGNDLWKALLRGAPLALLFSVVGALYTYIDSSRDAPIYEASTALLSSLPPSSVGGVELTAPSEVAPRVYQRFLMDGPIPAQVLEELSGKPPTDTEVLAFKRGIRIEIEDYKPLSSIVTISVRGGDRELVALKADLLAQKLIAWDRSRAEQAVDDAIEGLQGSIAALDAAIAQAANDPDADNSTNTQVTNAALRERLVQELGLVRSRKSNAVYASTLVQMVASDKDSLPIGPRVFLKTLVAAVSLLILTYAIQIVFWANSKRIRSSERLAHAVELPVLGTLEPGDVGNVWKRDPFTRAQAALFANRKLAEPLVVGITSPASFAEKSGVAFGLGRSLVTAGYSTIVLDGDFERAGPGFQLAQSGHTTSAVEELLFDPSKPIAPATMMFASGAKLDVLPVRGSSRLGAGDMDEKLSRLLKALAKKYEMIIIDCPPLLASARSMALAAHCTATILTVGASTSKADVGSAASILRLTGINIIGTLFTTRSWSKDRSEVGIRLSGGAVTTPGLRSSSGMTNSRPSTPVAQVRQRR